MFQISSFTYIIERKTWKELLKCERKNLYLEIYTRQRGTFTLFFMVSWDFLFFLSFYCECTMVPGDRSLPRLLNPFSILNAHNSPKQLCHRHSHLYTHIQATSHTCTHSYFTLTPGSTLTLAPYGLSLVTRLTHTPTWCVTQHYINGRVYCGRALHISLPRGSQHCNIFSQWLCLLAPEGTKCHVQSGRVGEKFNIHTRENVNYTVNISCFFSRIV